MRYHISPDTGRPNRCTATKRACPVAGEHYDSKEEARQAYEASRQAVPAGQRKGVAQYDTYDQPLRGTGTGPGGRAATRQRLETRPALTFEPVETLSSWATEVRANGELMFTVDTRKEAEMAQRALDAGQWVTARDLMAADGETLNDVDSLLTYQAEELDEELEAREDLLARTTQDPRYAREYNRALQDVEVARLAIAIHKAETSS